MQTMLGSGDGEGDDEGVGRIRKGGLGADPRLGRVTLSAVQSQCRLQSFCWHPQSSKWHDMDNYDGDAYCCHKY